MIITIDGPAGTGKSSVTKKVAERLNMIVLDTGALYRALAYGMIQTGIDIDAEEDVSLYLRKNLLEIALSEGSFHYFLGDVDTTMFLRTQDVAHAASVISTYASVREYLLPIQRELAKGRDVVCEGRDMGTTVFPEAPVKIFLTASVKERARRRAHELAALGIRPPSPETLEMEIEERDARDSTRKISPLKVPENAFIIDTTSLTLEEVVEEIVFLVKQEISPPGSSKGRWEHFSHQADIGLRGIGTTPAEAYEQTALALTAVITDPKFIAPKTMVTLSLKSDSDDLLLIDWLNAIIFEMAVRNMLFSRFHVTLLPGFLHASLWGEKVDKKKHQPAVEVKGATYHLLSIKQDEAGQWIAECIVDV